MYESNATETTYPALFPLSALQTEGYAQPEPRHEAAEDTEPEPEAA